MLLETSKASSGSRFLVAFPVIVSTNDRACYIRRSDRAVSNHWMLWTNNTCLPTTNRNAQCTLGYLPRYVIMAKTREHIQAGINFARMNNVRLIIRNTGHDFMGRSTGYSALAINTHSFKSQCSHSHSDFHYGSHSDCFQLFVCPRCYLHDAIYRAWIVPGKRCDSWRRDPRPRIAYTRQPPKSQGCYCDWGVPREIGFFEHNWLTLTRHALDRRLCRWLYPRWWARSVGFKIRDGCVNHCHSDAGLQLTKLRTHFSCRPSAVL